MNDMTLFLDLILIASGAYCMYTGYMMPPLAVMAVMTMGYGVCMLLNDLRETPFLPYPWPLVILAAVLASLVWYAIRNSRANREYFGM